MHPPIIGLFRTIDEAMYFKNSQLNTQFIFSGVQLLPNNSNKYIQVTNTPNGINLEDWTVKVISICGEELGDITDSFMVESLTNSINGNPQFIWSLTDIQTDFGYELIYLKITQTLGETFYSTPFKITSINEEKTSEITYKYKLNDEIQVIGFETWFREKDIKTTLETYYEESSKNTVTTAVQTNKLEVYRTNLMSRDALIQLIEVLTLPYVYIGGIRCSVFTAPEIPASASQENFSEITYQLSLKPNDIFVPISQSAGDWKAADWLANDFFIYN
jgi:hypothetical protein